MVDQRARVLERVLAVTCLAGSLELEPFLQEVIAVAQELTSSETAAILEVDERGKTLRFLAVPPSHQEVRWCPPIPMDQSVTAAAVEKAETVRYSSDEASSTPMHGEDVGLVAELHSLLAVPLLLPGRVLGVLEAINKAESHYTEEDATILESLATATALAIDRDSLKSQVGASLAELSELDRLKSDFIAITSHELRTPLGVILGHATYLRELVPPQYHEQVEAIIKNSTRLKEIVESLANMDNYRTGRARVHQEAISMAGVVAEVVASFAEYAAEREIALVAVPAAHDVLVEADHTKISIALGNLVKNALTFTNQGGKISVETDPMPGYVKVSVIDNGIGIPRKDLPRVFDRFFQVERHLTRRHNGMGLGLSVAKVMVEMHGGRIWVESSEGLGSTFSFVLPAHTPEAQPAMF